MLNGLKKGFIPHSKNDHQPHILREKFSAFLLILILLVEVFVFAQTIPVFRVFDLANVLPGVLIVETNEERIENGYSLLKTSPLLTQAAELKAQDMANRGYFSHNDPEGRKPWYWLKQVGYEYDFAGENLAVNFYDSKDVIDAWMDSSGHRQNILRGNFKEIGIATARGEYKGKNTIFVVQFLATPKIEPVVAINQSVKNEPVVVDQEILDEQPLAQTEEIKKPEVLSSNISMTEKIQASPRLTTSLALALIAGILTLALVLKIFITPKIQYQKLLLHGFLLLIIVASLLTLNHQYFANGLVGVS